MSGGASITLVGAGPVGSLMSIFLARRGYSVTIYERRPDPRVHGISAGRSINLALANRGIDALEKAGLMAEVEKLLIPMRGRMIHDGMGDTQLQPYGNKPHEVIWSASRGALNGLLMTAAERAGVTIRFDRRCDRVDLAARRLTLIDDATGTALEKPFEVLIGADGSGSAVRAAIARATGGMVSEDRLGHGYKELTIAPGADGSFRMEPNALHIWPRGGFMLIALPNLDGSFTATLFLPNEGGVSFAALKEPADVEAFFARSFADAVPLIDDLTGTFFANPTGALATIRCLPWRDAGRALVMGDAAHAIVPFHGQGMNAGFEDCVALDGRIEAVGGDWAAVFTAFETARKENAEAIADMALENYVEMRDSVRDPGFVLRRTLAWKLEEQYPDRFIPRYSMVMFHRLPYAEAYRRGRIQADILKELTREATAIDQVDFARAARLVEERLPERGDGHG